MKLGVMCCHADIINYGELPYTDFIRTETLRRGGKLCDFRVVGYFLQSKLADCLERNEKRERQVPKKGILATFNKIEMPSLDEGFDELNFVSIEDGEFRITKWIEDEI